MPSGLKKLIRQRMAETGESYQKAREEVIKERVWVIQHDFNDTLKKLPDTEKKTEKT